MTAIRRVTAVLLAVLLAMSVASTTAFADETTAPAAETTAPADASADASANADAADSMNVASKVLSLKMSETQGAIEQSPHTPAFWEYPVLRAGEDLQPGTMVVRNDSSVSASMALTPIKLPYGDTAKLTYLDSLLLTVTEGDRVLFQNTYAHVNDEEGGLTLRYDDMAPGEEHTYTIHMRCLYSYAGDPYADAVVMPWTFTAQRQTTVMDTPEGMPVWMIVTLVAAALVIVVMVTVTLVRSASRRAKKRALSPESAESESAEMHSADGADVQKEVDSDE